MLERVVDQVLVCSGCLVDCFSALAGEELADDGCRLCSAADPEHAWES